MTGSDFEALSVGEQSERPGRLADAALAQWPGGWSIRRLIKYRENAVFELAATDGARALELADAYSAAGRRNPDRS